MTAREKRFGVFASGESVDDISGARGFVRSTVYDHLEAAIKSGESLKPDRFFTRRATRGNRVRVSKSFRRETCRREVVTRRQA